MTRGRWIAALLALGIVTGLLAWQADREQRIARCHAAGGAWNGAASRCVPLPASPILRRDLERG